MCALVLMVTSRETNRRSKSEHILENAPELMGQEVLFVGWA